MKPNLATAAGVAGFDDSSWTMIAPETLSARRGTGRVSFNWYRLNITVPDRVGDFDPTGSTLWFDSELPRAYGQSGGSVIAGWNAINRLILTRNVKPGQKIQIAVFGINGPISNAPTNYIYVLEAKLDFYRRSNTTSQTDGQSVDDATAPIAVTPQEVNVKVERIDPRIDAIVPPNAKLFKLAEEFQFTEGPIWVRGGDYLLFSDPNHNTIYKYSAGALSVFRDRSGYDAADIADYGQPGFNGLTLDHLDRLTINEHGRHCVTRLEPDGQLTVLADHYQGKRLNSPNDLVYKSDGSLYFTDPPFGLPMAYADPRKQLPYSGVFRWQRGKLTLLTKALKGPNGIAFSPDEKFLYVSNWDPAVKTVTRYPVHHFAWGDDGKTLYLCARTVLYRIPLLVSGVRP